MAVPGLSMRSMDLDNIIDDEEELDIEADAEQDDGPCKERLRKLANEIEPILKETYGAEFVSEKRGYKTYVGGFAKYVFATDMNSYLDTVPEDICCKAIEMYENLTLGQDVTKREEIGDFKIIVGKATDVNLRGTPHSQAQSLSLIAIHTKGYSQMFHISLSVRADEESKWAPSGKWFTERADKIFTTALN